MYFRIAGFDFESDPGKFELKDFNFLRFKNYSHWQDLDLTLKLLEIFEKNHNF